MRVTRGGRVPPRLRGQGQAPALCAPTARPTSKAGKELAESEMVSLLLPEHGEERRHDPLSCSAAAVLHGAEALKLKRCTVYNVQPVFICSRHLSTCQHIRAVHHQFQPNIMQACAS